MICQHCGNLIIHSPYRAENKLFCCEHCFLKARDECARQNDSCTLLAEILVNALDLRQHVWNAFQTCCLSHAGFSTTIYQ